MIDELGLPLVVKIPDGSFSRGVHKIESPAALKRICDELFEETDLLLAQKFLPTDFDWRVGVLAGEPLFVCQYRMARGHWQVVKYRPDGSSREGGFRAFDLAQAPREVMDIAVRAARPIGDGFYGVDLKQTDNGIVVMEVNDNPNLEHGAVEGVMLKRRDSLYLPGRPKGPWWKWKRDPFIIDAVLMYAQRGHGKRSSYYSDYTFGVWTRGDGGEELVPVGKAYFGFTDEELLQIDRFVRRNTTDRFGPVREVVHEPDQGLVLEVAFEGLQRSTRHKSGLAMRFPRINRLRWDKPPGEADRLERLETMIARIEEGRVA